MPGSGRFEVELNSNPSVTDQNNFYLEYFIRYVFSIFKVGATFVFALLPSRTTMQRQILVIDESKPSHALIKALLADDPVDIHSAMDATYSLVLAASIHTDL